jgi:hypothetical protein
MGILKALSNAFTPRQFLKPYQWLRAIPLLQDALIGSLPLHLVNLQYCRDLFEALEALLLVEERLKKEVELSREREKEEPWYPVKMTDRQFWLVEQLLYNSWMEGDY